MTLPPVLLPPHSSRHQALPETSPRCKLASRWGGGGQILLQEGCNITPEITCGGGHDGNSPPKGPRADTMTSHTAGTCGAQKEWQCLFFRHHRQDARGPHHRKPSVRNGLTAGPDIHRFPIGIFPQDLGGQVAWGASKTCSRREGRATLSLLPLPVSPHLELAPRASSPALLTPAALTLSALSAQAADGDGLGFLECPESKPEGQDSCLPGTPAPPQRPREHTADSSQTRCTDSRGPGGTWCPPTLLHCLKRPGPLKA